MQDARMVGAELSTMLGKDSKKLAREVRASFGLPWQLQELGLREATLWAPPAPPCLCRQRFMPPADSFFACRDIREIPREKVVAYTRALQHWTEQNNPPAGGEPCLLAKTILELREEVKWYLSFTNEEVLWGVALPEREEEENPRALDVATMPQECPTCHSLLWKREPQSFWDGRRCCIHPNQWWPPGISPN